MIFATILSINGLRYRVEHSYVLFGSREENVLYASDFSEN